MGKTYKQFSLEERCTIASLYKSGGSIWQIVSSLDRSPSSISREINRNTGTGAKVVYRPDYADEMAWARRWTGSKMERQAISAISFVSRRRAGSRFEPTCNPLRQALARRASGLISRTSLSGA